ncbi:LCP family protein [Paenibacillus sp. y28]
MMRKLKWSLMSIGIMLLAVVGYYGYSVYQFSSNIQDKQDSLFSQFNTAEGKETNTYNPPKWEGKERVNILLMGGDSRGVSKNDAPRSDSMLIASIDPVTKKSYLFSILRDTYVSIPGKGQDRINTALAYGGPKLAMQTISDFIGEPIQYYVYTDFKGFIALIDAIGGVDFEVEKDMKYYDSEEPEYAINLKKGYQHLDGKQALQYVRFRHDALSDFNRTGRQRDFLQAVATKLQSSTSLVKLPSILSSIDPYIETNLSISQMLKLGTLAYDVKTEGMVSVQLPPMELVESKTISGASVLTTDKTKMHQYIDRKLAGETLLADEPDTKKSGSAGTAGTTGSSGNKSTTGSTGTSTSSGTKSSTTTGNSSTGSAGSSSGTGKTGTTGSSSGTTTGTGSSSTNNSSKTNTGSTTNSGKTDTGNSPQKETGGTGSAGTGTGSKNNSSGTSGNTGGSGSTGSTGAESGKENSPTGTVNPKDESIDGLNEVPGISLPEGIGEPVQTKPTATPSPQKETGGSTGNGTTVPGSGTSGGTKPGTTPGTAIPIT